MTPVASLPQAVRPFLGFTEFLRRYGFMVAPEQTIGFIEAIGLLGPSRMNDIQLAAAAMLAPPVERRSEFDALFRHYFHGQILEAPVSATDDDEDLRVQDTREGPATPPEAGDPNPVGGEAAASEALSLRVFSESGETDALRSFSKLAADRLPRRRSRRMMAGRGNRYDLRRSLRQAVRYDGELVRLSKMRRRTTLRRIVLLIDVSGSMKEQTESLLKLAHTLVRAAGSSATTVEVFTVGTRLTRITPALRLRSLSLALDSAAAVVADWDGGTRLGDALETFLAVPRFAGFLRGASVVVVSDGLELGEPDALERAVRRMSRLSWRFDWLTPLAADPDFAPRTRALTAILPSLTSLGDGSRMQAICAHLLHMARPVNPNELQATGLGASRRN